MSGVPRILRPGADEPGVLHIGPRGGRREADAHRPQDGAGRHASGRDCCSPQSRRRHRAAMDRSEEEPPVGCRKMTATEKKRWYRAAQRAGGPWYPPVWLDEQGRRQDRRGSEEEDRRCGSIHRSAVVATWFRWAVSDLKREVPAKGVFQSIHGPLPTHDEWTRLAFQL